MSEHSPCAPAEPIQRWELTVAATLGRIEAALTAVDHKLDRSIADQDGIDDRVSVLEKAAARQRGALYVLSVIAAGLGLETVAVLISGWGG